MTRHSLRLFAIILALAAIITVPSSAQRRGKGKPATSRKHIEQIDTSYTDENYPAAEKETPLAKQLKSDLAVTAFDYWTVKLNNYKSHIDGMLAPCDLTEVNRLRVYWSIFLDQKKWQGLATKFRKEFDGGGDEGDSGGDEGGPGPSGMKKKKAEEIGALVDNVSEMAETFFVAKWIARRYRPQFTAMQETVSGDFTAFIDTVIAAKDRFALAHQAEIASDPSVQNIMKELNREKADEAMKEFSSKGDMGIFVGLGFNVLVEPLMVLYNGQDLRRLFKSVDVLPKELSELELGDASVLEPNVPNPAVTTTTINYTLPEASSRTTLRLYDARGELVGTYDQGDRPAGRYQVNVDVSTLSSGFYLYYLTTMTSQGERVYSRTLQVAR
ncbi:MAG: domain containing protein [Chlorobi bacterium]|nr:domain containing protein [Chlorobiota bacterium]